jgi:hypothetical protein
MSNFLTGLAQLNPQVKRHNGSTRTMSDAWKAYRKKLRDLPGTLDDTTVLETITWPTEPS